MVERAHFHQFAQFGLARCAIGHCVTALRLRPDATSVPPLRPKPRSRTPATGAVISKPPPHVHIPLYILPLSWLLSWFPNTHGILFSSSYTCVYAALEFVTAFHAPSCTLTVAQPLVALVAMVVVTYGELYTLLSSKYIQHTRMKQSWTCPYLPLTLMLQCSDSTDHPSD